MLLPFRRRSKPVPRIRIVETGEARNEVEVNDAGGAVALLFDDDLGLGFVGLAQLLVAFVVGLAMDESDHVGVLLDGAGLAQVGELGAMVDRKSTRLNSSHL